MLATELVQLFVVLSTSGSLTAVRQGVLGQALVSEKRATPFGLVPTPAVAVQVAKDGLLLGLHCGDVEGEDLGMNPQ